MRVVVDTNVLVSATLFEHSLPGRAVFTALRVAELLLSIETLTELHEVLHRPKFNKYLTVEEREAFLTALTMRATMVEVSIQIDDCRDPKDNKFLELAVAGRAECIVTGDKDLLVLHPFRQINIVTPTDFIALYS